MKQSASSEPGVYDLDLLRDLTGGVATREFDQSSDALKPDLYAWAQALRDMDDAEFVKNAAFAIYDSANMSRFGGMDHVHFKGSAFFHESDRRFGLAHPDEDCNATTLYERAYNMAVRDAGHSHMASEIRPCTCGTAPTEG